MITIYTAILALPVILCVSIALWMFGVRPYIRHHGGCCITAANWGLSIWADLTSAWEIGKEEGHIPLSVKMLCLLQVILILLILFVMIATAID